MPKNNVEHKEFVVIPWNERNEYRSANVIAWYYSSYHAEQKAAQLVAEGQNVVVRSRKYLR